MNKWVGVFAVTYLASGFAAYSDSSAVSQSGSNRIFSLPQEIAGFLRKKNRGGRGGCPESNIFIHGINHLDFEFERSLVFLGAPDYLCESNSFISVIVDSTGNWSTANDLTSSPSDVELLAGAPDLFKYSKGFGYLLTTIWQVEGPRHSLYYSPDGLNWTSIDLPKFSPKKSETDCCSAAELEKICVVDSKALLVATSDTADFPRETWSTPFDKSHPAKTNWTQVEAGPTLPSCAQRDQSDFIPRLLREKTNDYVIFDISDKWAVRIPGPTK